MKDPGWLRKSELVFDTPKVESDWKEAVFSAVPKEHHERHQAGILLTMANLHRLLGSHFVCSIHNMGIGNWATMRFHSTADRPLRRIVTAVERFGEESNQTMASFAERNQNRVIADLKRAEGSEELEKHRAKALFLSDAISIYGRSIFSCRADPRVATWLQNRVEASADKIFGGQSFVHLELARIARTVELIRARRILMAT